MLIDLIIVFVIILFLHSSFKSSDTFFLREQIENMWYSPKYFKIHKSIPIKELQGYVLPHAGTKYTGAIISHTLRFKPLKKFNRVLIMYLPAFKKPNVNNKYYHEYFVPQQSIKHCVDKIWKIKNKVRYEGFNVLTDKNLKIDENTLSGFC